MSAHLAACWGLWNMECFASNRICGLLSLSVNGTQLDRVVLINEGCYKTWCWIFCGMELRTKGSNGTKPGWDVGTEQCHVEHWKSVGFNLGVRLDISNFFHSSHKLTIFFHRFMSSCAKHLRNCLVITSLFLIYRSLNLQAHINGV